MLLWLLSTVLAILAAYIVQGWLRQALKRPKPLLAFGPLAVGGFTWGSLVSSVAVLSIAAAPLPFPVGFQNLVAPVLWVSSIVAAVLAIVGLLWRRAWWMFVICGALMTAATLPIQYGWITAAGFRPGIVWREELLVVAGAVMTFGYAVGWWLALADSALQGGRQLLWRLGAAALMGLTLLAGPEITSLAAGLLAQVGSVYQYQVPAAVLALVGGAALPLLLFVLLLDLEIRRQSQRRKRRGMDTSHIMVRKREKRRSRTREA
jgi:hypothetical protein